MRNELPDRNQLLSAWVFPGLGLFSALVFLFYFFREMHQGYFIPLQLAIIWFSMGLFAILGAAKIVELLLPLEGVPNVAERAVAVAGATIVPFVLAGLIAFWNPLVALLIGALFAAWVFYSGFTFLFPLVSGLRRGIWIVAWMAHLVIAALVYTLHHLVG